jgi:hypothetical protein
MNTSFNSPITAPRSITGEGWAAIVGAIGSALLLAKKVLNGKQAKPELMSRAEFLVEMLELRERLNANHLALLEKLEANHRELLAALGREADRVGGLEAGFARLEERTQARSR